MNLMNLFTHYEGSNVASCLVLLQIEIFPDKYRRNRVALINKSKDISFSVMTHNMRTAIRTDNF